MSSLPVFPVLPGLTFTVVKTSGFKTLLDSAPNEYEVRLPQTTNPIWEWTLIYDASLRQQFFVLGTPPTGVPTDEPIVAFVVVQ